MWGMRLLLVPFLVLCLAVPAGAETIRVSSKRVPFNADDRGQRNAGQLVWRGGIALRSRDRRFGGYSDLHVSADGRSLLAVSDRGTWLQLRLSYNAAGELAGAADARVGPLRDIGGVRLRGKEGDAESMAVMPDGSIVVGFERRHRLRVYPPGANPLSGVPRAYPTPPGVEDGPSNGGIETLVHVGGGYLLAISERQRARPGALLGWVGVDGGWRRFRYARTGGFRPTSALLLANGDVLVLERRFILARGNAIRIVRIPRRAVAPGRLVRGHEIARLQAPMTVDNFEGIAARHGSAGETLIYLLSDDNFNPLQQTLLLMFSLKER